MSTGAHSSLVALLGPTNTGKTHRAVERMLEHKSGMIGLPLRLLAREVYDRVTARIGELEVALVTGEEKRVPPRPRYWICTTEAMPRDRAVDFVAVDEVQLAAHPQRGHVFTDRLLHARGARETWFLGADTIRPAIEQLLPTASIRRHPRFSKLSAVGALGLASLPPRTAVIAFSAAEVYELADRLRGRRGGAAVVLGALSPRTRNAQVAMYQAGEVDYLVATDAIGMGLNMDVDHVAFASLTKFDGRHTRALAADELGQIAGRAGRHIKDGSFGTLTPASLDPEIAFAVERHRYSPVRRLVWRSSDLEWSSIAALARSLRERPRRGILQLVEQADDFTALGLLAERPEIAERARGEDGVRLLWQVCQIPDFRKLLAEHHASLLAEIFLGLSAGGGRLDGDFMEQRVRRLESDEGDIDTLLMRLELIRTWSYVAHRGGWLDDAGGWQQRTTRAEDQLSRALHQRLIERFVDRLGRKRRSSRGKPSSPGRSEPGLDSSAAASPFAQLGQLRSSLRDAGGAATSDEASEWTDEAVAAGFDDFAIDPRGSIAFRAERIAQLVRGADLTHPEVKLVLERHAGEGARSLLLRRLRAHARDLVKSALAPIDPDALGAASAPVRGLLYQLEQSLGTITVKSAAPQLRALSPDDRERLEACGVRLGRKMIYAETLIDARAVGWRIALLSAWSEQRPAVGIEPGTVAARREPNVSAASYLLCGYAELGPLAIRADAVERLYAELERLGEGGPFACPEELAASLGRTLEEIEGAIIALGFAASENGFVPRGRPARSRARRARQGPRQRD